METEAFGSAKRVSRVVGRLNKEQFACGGRLVEEYADVDESRNRDSTTSAFFLAHAAPFG
jgi:hypothetical protein